MNFSSVSGKNWAFNKFKSSDVSYFCENYSLSEILSKLLSIRKRNIVDINLFLDPKIKNLLPNPLILKDMKKAVDRVYNCIKNNDYIGIFGDYDVDGAASTALLARYFLSLNVKTNTYIPDRQKEGYGPNILGFQSLINKNSKIIFTVDCGTSSYKSINYAQKKGIDVIVLDHHQSDTNLPKAHAIVNPNRYDDTSNLNYLCATGVCFVFLVAMNKKLRDEKWFLLKSVKEPQILDFLDLVSLGTVCDVVPLIGLNRALVTQGLKVIKKRSNLGLKTLYDLCKIESQPTTYDLGFILGPRINAGGRVGKSSHGVELLTSNDPKKTYDIAIDLEKSNSERKEIESMLLEKVNIDVEKFHNHPVLVLSGNNWHEGVMGIIASRIKDRYNKPTILISIDSTQAKGSARSVIGFDIGSNIIKAVQLNILEKGGGHKMAGGFSLKKEKISEFRDYLINSFEKSKIDTSKNRDLYIDSIISPSAMNEDFYNEINTLAPFGSGNNEPKFVIENVKVISGNIVGKNHIKSILIGKDGSTFNSFLWNGKDTSLEPYLTEKNKKIFNVAGKMHLNEWKGKKKIEFIIDDISIY